MNPALQKLIFGSILICLLPLSECFAAESRNQLILQQGEMIQSAIDSPPSSSANWTATSLPYTDASLATDDFATASSTWFRFKVPDEITELTPSGLPLGLYIPRHNIRLSVFLDERYLGGSAEMRFGQLRSAWNHPVLLELPTSVSDSEYIFIHLIGGPSGPILTEPVIAEHNDLEALYDDRYFWQITTSQWSFGICLIMAFLAAWIWSQRRQETLYLRIAGMSLCWAAALTLSFLEFIPLSFRLWAFVYQSAIDWGAYLLVSYVLVSSNIRASRLRSFLFYSVCLATITHAVIPDGLFFQTALFFNAIESIIVTLVVLLLFRQAISQPENIRLWFVVAFAGILALMFHDIYVVFLVTEEEWVKSSNWVQMAMPLLTIAFYGDLVSRFTKALSDTENLNRDLEERVAESRNKLEKIYAQNREFELERATNEERNKIYRDLHDDVGSKLASIIHKSETNSEDKKDHSENQDIQTKQLARSALESLRAAIFRANFSETSLTEFLEKISEEMAIRLSSAGLHFERNKHISAAASVDAKTAYHLTRVFRELTSNILHHAAASSVKLIMTQEGKTLHCALTDNGVGFSEDSQANGGISSIRFRVSELGGAVTWEEIIPSSSNSNPQENEYGTLTSISVPLELRKS